LHIKYFNLSFQMGYVLKIFRAKGRSVLGLKTNIDIHHIIFASQGLRSALLIFTLGIVRRIFVIPAHCHLLDFDSYAPCNDVIFNARLSFPFVWMPWKLTQDYNRQYLLIQTFCMNSVAANHTNFFILSKSCRTDDFSHFYFVDIFPTEHVLFVKPVLIGCSYH
jgi:hypothetical protein